jgi:Mismatch repair ATPase (MutS family)
MSSVGEESLYKRLRTLRQNGQDLEKFGKMTECFEEHSNISKKLQSIYASIGRTKSVSFYDFIVKASKLKTKSSWKHYIGIFLILACIAGFFIVPVYAVIAFLLVLSCNIYFYYKEKNDVNNYFICFEYIIRLIRYGGQIAEILKELKNNVFQKDITEIEALLDKTKGLKKGIFLISSQSVNDSVVEMVMQYIRMIFHVDLIKFNSMVKKTSENIENINQLYEVIGDVEAALAAASFRTCLKEEYGFYCIPDLNQKQGICFENIYHPLIKNAVTNSMQKEKNILLTGSNASGKSTFLKTVAINAILSQTIYTATARSYAMPYTMVCSSMALKDDLSSNDSYYMAEIKALKRIMDKTGGNRTVLCFIDEVLRGTNTIERIAASSEILKYFRQSNVICFAATHDIELTYILEGCYANYHFEEEVSGDDVKFNYRLNRGRTVTRNAIRLLKLLGYPGNLVDNAEDRVSEFTKTGKWKNS